MIRRLPVHPTILLMSAAHVMVDGYANIYAPLLPVLIPRLGLTLAAAGTLTMLFQMAASVAQDADMPTFLPGNHSRLPCLPRWTIACALKVSRIHR